MRRSARRWRRRHPAPVWLGHGIGTAAVLGLVWSGLDLVLLGGWITPGELTAIGAASAGAGFGSWLRGEREIGGWRR